jgi:hypothetical protein
VHIKTSHEFPPPLDFWDRGLTVYPRPSAGFISMHHYAQLTPWAFCSGRVFPSFFFPGVMGFELRTSGLLDKCSTTWATPPAPPCAFCWLNGCLLVRQELGKLRLLSFSPHGLHRATQEASWHSIQLSLEWMLQERAKQKLCLWWHRLNTLISKIPYWLHGLTMPRAWIGSQESFGVILEGTKHTTGILSFFHSLC